MNSWNADIAELKRRLNRACRLTQRARGRNEFTELQEKYRILRSDLKMAIVRSKIRCYEEMCADVNENP